MKHPITERAVAIGRKGLSGHDSDLQEEDRSQFVRRSSDTGARDA